MCAHERVVVLTPERILEVTRSPASVRDGKATSLMLPVRHVSHGQQYLRHFRAGFAARSGGPSAGSTVSMRRFRDRGRSGRRPPGSTLVAHEDCDQHRGGRRTRDVRDLSGAGARGLQGGEGRIRMASSIRIAHIFLMAWVRVFESPKSRLRRARFRSQQRLHHPRAAEEWSDPRRRRGSTALLAWCSGVWKRRASARLHSAKAALHPSKTADLWPPHLRV